MTRDIHDYRIPLRTCIRLGGLFAGIVLWLHGRRLTRIARKVHRLESSAPKQET